MGCKHYCTDCVKIVGLMNGKFFAAKNKMQRSKFRLFDMSGRLKYKFDRKIITN